MTGVAVSDDDEIGDVAIGDGAIGETILVGTEVGADVDTWLGTGFETVGSGAAGEDVMEGGSVEGGSVLQLGCLPAGGYFPLPDATLSGAILSAFKIHLVSI